ncbi:helicase [Paenibacillus faecis]|uniref:HelD family protein n=1 Tax=Paenibacillus faecis TaxID=862114 RepID=UPI001B15E238|nr:3'-5' exonuclease [Paenibacillus faecis]GIO84336.1 helicase [Paenibacillus faecis]
MINRTETQESMFLKEITNKLRQAVEEISQQVSVSYKEIVDAKKYVWSNIGQLDPAERAANRMDIGLRIDAGEKAKDKLRKLGKLLESPYFGRVDFKLNGKEDDEPFYIGIHAFSEEEDQTNLIYDWRSPVATLFYDFERGPAYFEAPDGKVEGLIALKRQYKIRNGSMEYMIESSMNIHDDVLQKELSATSDEKMKNIVATIQKEQNAVIRNETSHELIIQGVAGSGKTSVALHRIAFLLYKQKGVLTSRNILILSPNKVFSDYISNVLPELGEENMLETGVQELASAELDRYCRFQTFDEQVVDLIQRDDPQVKERIAYKSRVEFVAELDEFIEFSDLNDLVAADLQIQSFFIPKELISTRFYDLRRMPVKARLGKVADLIIAELKGPDGEKPSASAARSIRSAIQKMYRHPNLLTLYKAFYAYMGKQELFKPLRPKTIEYSDVFPLIYLKHYYEGLTPYEFVKHLVVDEMQDYTPVQYAVLSILFTCKKTILGDAGQSVNPYSSTSLEKIKSMLPAADTVQLNQSYRSTLEITEFARTIKNNPDLIPVKRHGEEPRIEPCDGDSEEMDRIHQHTDNFLRSKYRSLGIICKSSAQVDRVYRYLQNRDIPANRLDFNSQHYHEGIVVTTAHLAKGLEFDSVLVPFVTHNNYRNEMDQSLLYIACTRAMHQLVVTYAGTPSRFLPA